MHLFKHCPHRNKSAVNRSVDHSKPQSFNTTHVNATMIDSLEPVNGHEPVIHCDNDLHDNATVTRKNVQTGDILPSDVNHSSSNDVHVPTYSNLIVYRVCVIHL